MQGPVRRPIAVPKASAIKAPSPSQRLWRHAAWGCATAAALLAAVAASRSETGMQRVAPILSSWRAAQNEPQRQSFDAEGAARTLAQAIRDLREDRDRLAKRLTAAEHNMDDLTGSVQKQVEEAKAVKTPPPAPWPLDAPPVPMTPADVAAMVKSVSAPDTPPTPAEAAPAAESAPATAAPVRASPAYGADVASASSMRSLRTRWTGLRSAHRHMFEGLEPVVSLRENGHSGRVELHLVVGPYPSADAAMQLCLALEKFHQRCEPTMMDGNHLALD